MAQVQQSPHLCVATAWGLGGNFRVDNQKKHVLEGTWMALTGYWPRQGVTRAEGRI